MTQKVSLTPEWLILAASGLLILGYNQSLWQYLMNAVPEGSRGMVTAAAFLVMIFLLFNGILQFLAFRPLLKPILILLLLVSSIVVYFSNQYGVLIDSEMFRNLMETDPTEVRDLLSPNLFGHFLFMGLLPALAVYFIPVNYSPLQQHIPRKLLMLLISVSLFFLVAMLNYQGLSSLLRNHRDLRFHIVPSNFIGATLSYFHNSVAKAQQPLRPIGEDARLGNAWQNHRRKSLTVIVVGESARAENFSLNGYSRQTNPELSAIPDIISLNNVSSCGTSTAVSLPCMFSSLPRRNYKDSIAKTQEGLLDILQRAGLQVIWRDNQSGCKGVCDQVAQVDMKALADRALCSDGECHDEILLKNLQSFIDGLDRDTVLVLHQMGSHGPAYSKRYPTARTVFEPVCQSAELTECSQESIINAYDNTLAYTDHVLSQLIALLRSNQNRVDTAMIYLSDHGESLGEYHLYLHGTPYMLAPRQQTHIPMILWFSPGYTRDFSVNSACMRQRSGLAYSHDNLFHSVLGLLQIETSVYEKNLDIFAGCRSQP